MKQAFIISAFIITVVIGAFVVRSMGAFSGSSVSAQTEEGKESKKDKKKKKDKSKDDEPSEGIVIRQKWDMPDVLKEISALTYIDRDRFGCVQDEIGKIFIYNTSTKKVEKEIPFAGTGDYEGLAIVNQTAYVLRADGQIFEVKNYLSGKPETVLHKTHLTVKHDTEAMCYDSKNNRLLVAVKGSEGSDVGYKGIYSFDLKSFKMAKEPTYKINFDHPVFEKVKAKKQESVIAPSAIAIHPQTGDIYITEGTKPKLLIMDKNGNIKDLRKLNKSDFNQPEGIIFRPDASLFVSNEGTKTPGNILEIEAL
ncbi:hypothetical protein [Desertivirga arenae]|uniref:hypothetical protein n=1 Tax=Desertivirga arenae TaxID=2810309 RepID=UPI001A971EC3|nr:hypothetical protein [Pedobacter sp. SYSU D00823]